MDYPDEKLIRTLRADYEVRFQGSRTRLLYIGDRIVCNFRERLLLFNNDWRTAYGF